MTEQSKIIPSIHQGLPSSVKVVSDPNGVETSYTARPPHRLSPEEQEERVKELSRTPKLDFSDMLPVAIVPDHLLPPEGSLSQNIFPASTAYTQSQVLLTAHQTALDRDSPKVGSPKIRKLHHSGEIGHNTYFDQGTRPEDEGAPTATSMLEERLAKLEDKITSLIPPKETPKEKEAS